jgi:hypothetical protein
MKRILFVFALMAAVVTANGQEIGIRFGDALGNNYAVDAVFGTGEFRRIHADVNFGDEGVGVEALWDFLYKPLGGEAFNWYVGAGPSLLLGDTFKLGVSGEIGLEYHFNGAPIALGADWRPTFVLVEDTEFEAGGFGFNVRYVFGMK